MNFVNLPKVENTRARFLRRQTTELVGGWIVGERDLRVVLESDAEHRLEPGEELVGEIHLHLWKLTMRSKVIRSMVIPGEMPRTVSVMDPMTTDIERGDGRERFRIPSSGVRVCIGTRHVTARLADASVGGLGIWVAEALDPSDRILCEVTDGIRRFELEGVVRYTQSELEGYRYGLELEHLDRISRSKWDRYIIERNRRERRAA